LEEGVDVLCALALIREASDPNIDLVILASQDTDLEAALDEALSLGTAKAETASWYDNVDRRASKEIASGRQRNSAAANRLHGLVTWRPWGSRVHGLQALC
jgi:uncharacterized protein (UPF0548 family)